MKKLVLALCLIIPPGVTLFAGAPVAQAQPTATQVETVDRLFKASGREYTRVGPKQDIFMIQQGPSSFYFLGTDEYLLGFSVLAKKGGFKASVAALTACLTINGDMDYVKLFIDDKGALAIRFETPLSSLDQKQFNFLTDQLIAAEGESREKLKSYLIK